MEMAAILHRTIREIPPLESGFGSRPRPRDRGGPAESAAMPERAFRKETLKAVCLTLDA